MYFFTSPANLVRVSGTVHASNIRGDLAENDLLSCCQRHCCDVTEERGIAIRLVASFDNAGVIRLIVEVFMASFRPGRMCKANVKDASDLLSQTSVARTAATETIPHVNRADEKWSPPQDSQSSV